ncbi:hypothetical protein MKZ38_007278 [Zalerion maritima]|uniref:Uncharacterized protein n=1 Tax=Zalerion maritima TaxID=339359 RepID=A0AAD5RJ44_9PEZI|nr:hypothetical protein MKZ38_007278 [Zalerion maritima]
MRSFQSFGIRGGIRFFGSRAIRDEAILPAAGRHLSDTSENMVTNTRAHRASLTLLSVQPRWLIVAFDRTLHALPPGSISINSWAKPRTCFHDGKVFEDPKRPNQSVNSSPDMSNWALPHEAGRTELTNALDELAAAMERSSLLAGENKHPSAFFVWDFSKRTHHVLINLSKIYNREAVSQPEAFPKTSKPAPGEPQDGPSAAKKAWEDVIDRSGTTADMITGEGLGMMLLMMSGLQGCEWDNGTKEKARQLKRVVGARGLSGM